LTVARVAWLLLCLLALVAGSASGWAALRAASPSEPARTEQALPRFSGPLVGGGHGGSQLLDQRRALLVAFSPGNKDAERVAQMVNALAPEATEANVFVLGIAMGVDPLQASRAVRRFAFDFPVVVDTSLDIARKLRVTPGRTAVLAVDAQGYIIGGFPGLESEPEMDGLFEDELRRALHLRRSGGALAPTLGLMPAAPAFEVESLSGEKLSSAGLDQRVRVVMFFSPTCPHCHEVLGFFKTFLAQIEREDVVFVPVSITERRYIVEQMSQDLELDFPVYLDAGSVMQQAYDHRLAVPDTIVIGRDGRIRARHSGAGPRLQALLSMEIREALGAKNPILLERSGYSGDEFCQVCHTQQHETWSLTTHAGAFTTLVEHGEDRNSECLPCHTVGWNEPGGYSMENRVPFLEGVQCENCHGRGGPHQSPGFVDAGYEPICASCHTPEHSLRFVFAERLPMVSHAANLQFAALSLEERIELLERRDKRERTLFEQADYVGSQSCAGCHAQEHALWSKSSHARALDTLEARGERANDACQKCHTTGFDQAGGWPAGGEALAGVGCESCHGPGGNHIGPTARRDGTILALTDKCDSCVIMQICGSCHDDANDPGFEFELDDKLDAIRHGFRDRDRPDA
jgi:peroxiredoxin